MEVGIEGSSTAMNVMEIETEEFENGITEELENGIIRDRPSNKALPLIPVEHLRSVICCSGICLAAVTTEELADRRRVFQEKRTSKQHEWLLGYLHDHASCNPVNLRYTYHFTIGSLVVCQNAWQLTLGVKDRRLRNAKSAIESGKTEAKKREGGLLPRTAYCVQWVRRFANTVGDKMPNDSKIRLPTSLTKRDVYQEYIHDCNLDGIPGMDAIHLGHFYKIWDQEMHDIVIPREDSGFATCDQCDRFRRLFHQEKSKEGRNEVTKLRNQHLEKQKAERAKYYKHMAKAYNGSIMCIIMDGMDQEKTYLPHFMKITKSVAASQRLKMHLTGAIVHGRGIYGYFDCGQWSHSANMNGSILIDILTKHETLPPVLCLQFDNAADNKNQFLIGLFCLLVERKVFRKVKINYLMVGHTHENIDQMFSCFSRKLAKADAFTIDELMQIFRTSYTSSQGLQPMSTELETVYDIREWITPHIQANLKYITEHHCFKIELDDSEKAVIYSKQWSTDLEWTVAASKDDEAPHFLLTHPSLDAIRPAHTNFQKVMGTEYASGSLISSIRRCYPIFQNENVSGWWEKWIEEFEDSLKNEQAIREQEIDRPVEPFTILKNLLDRERGVPVQETPQISLADQVPVEAPARQMVFGRANRIFRCKTHRMDEVDCRYCVGDMVLLDVQKL